MVSRISDDIVWRDTCDGNMLEDRRSSVMVSEVLDDGQVCHVVKQCVGEAAWRLLHAELRPAADGIAGFLGDHFRLTVRVSLDGRPLTIPLFIKCLPLNNAPKAEFIDEHNFNRKEMAVFKLIEEMQIQGPNPFVVKALLYNESVLVMHDLASEGYSIRNQLEYFDLPHLLVTLASLARFHAAVADHETRRTLSLQRPYSVIEDHEHILIEHNFKDTPWIRSGAKLTANIMHHFSDKYSNTIPDLEAKLLKQFLAACADLAATEDSLNVVLHKDLWVNNVMFKYENGVPTNSILVDFQCVRYGPPSFDVVFLLYNTTSRSFREFHEATALRHYFNVFMESVENETKLRLKGLGYDFEEFVRWVESSRRFGVLSGIMLGPYVLLDPATAQATFDDPATFDKYTNEDRSEPVLAHARRCPDYKRRQLEVIEEFIDRYLHLQP